MRRLHLFEFSDQWWFPRVLRDAETAYLAMAYRISPKLPQCWAEKISTAFQAGEPEEILDLCSGAGGPLPLIINELEKRGYNARARLTELHPHLRPPSHPRIEWVTQPVDATRVSRELAGVRTIFSAFHHFRPDAAKAILKDALEQRRAICIFESGSGTLLGLLSMIVIPIFVLALMPFARPFRWAYVLFTYLIPLMPLIILWDGSVSMLRVYSPEQMKTMTADLEAPDYSWEIGRIPVRRVPDGLPYLIGRPCK